MDHEEIKQRYMAGETCASIARYAGVSRQAVHQTIQRLKLPYRRSLIALRNDTIRLDSSNMSTPDLAVKYHLALSTTYKLITAPTIDADSGTDSGSVTGPIQAPIPVPVIPVPVIPVPVIQAPVIPAVIPVISEQQVDGMDGASASDPDILSFLGM